MCNAVLFYFVLLNDKYLVELFDFGYSNNDREESTKYKNFIQLKIKVQNDVK